MRIVVFSTDDHLHPAGGAESAMGEITKRLPDIEFHLICARIRRNTKQYERVNNVHIHRLGIGHPKIDAILLALLGHQLALRLYNEHPFDLVWSIMASYGAFSAVRVKKATGIPFVLTLQEGDPTEEILYKVRFVRRQFNDIFRSADALQPISNYLRNWGLDMGFEGEVSAVIPNGVDVSTFTKEYDQKTLEEKRDTFGFPSNATILVTSSRLEKKNGVGDIIDALPQLSKNVCLVIAGGGSLEDELKQKVQEHGLEKRVLFLGYIPIEEIPLVLKASDIFIRPSLTEGLGNAFLEAMAAGLPTIGTPVGGIPDFLKDDETGFLCEPQNSDSIVRTVENIVSLPKEELERIQKNAKDMVLEHYTWDRISTSMKNIFTHVVNKKTQ